LIGDPLENAAFFLQKFKFFISKTAIQQNSRTKIANFKQSKSNFLKTLSFFHNFQQSKAPKIHFLLKNSKIFNKFRNYILPFPIKSANFPSTFYKLSNFNSGLLWQIRH